jgi:putative hydrolase of the HAD superfamily
LFLSFETGLLKPDLSAFKQVLNALNCKPQELLFLDDNALNIESALQLGIQAQLTRGADELREHLARRRLLSAIVSKLHIQLGERV